MSANDLQPKQFRVKVKGNEFNCQPLRLSHRLIMGRIQPLFNAANDIATGNKVELKASEILELESDLDALIGSLVPELKNINLDIMDIADLLSQMMESMLPDDAKELKEAKVEASENPKEETIGTL